MVVRISLFLIGVFIACGAAAADLPRPEGPHGVGYWRGDVFSHQDDKLTADPDDKRRLALALWYPGRATPKLVRKPWASPAMAAALSKNFPLPKGFEKQLSTHAYVGAPPIAGRLPVVIFSHGLSFPPTLYQSFFEDWASRGFVVVAVSHPHGAVLTEYPDGSSLTMAAWPATAVDDKSEKLLAEQSEIWAEDLRTVIDWLVSGALKTPVEGRLDASRIAVAGHSLGGTAAARLSSDSRVKAAIIMEGLVRDPADPKSRGTLQVGAPLLHLIGGYNRLELEGQGYVPGNSAPVYQVVVNGTGHAYFSDLIYLYRDFADADWRQRHRYEVDPGRVLQIARDHADAFLDYHLNGNEQSVLLRPKSYADRVEGPRQAGYPEVDLSITTK